MTSRAYWFALALLGSALLFAGCAPTPTYTFQVAVRNDCSQPVTAWLTKDGPPPEAGWLSPEQTTQVRPYDDDTQPGIVIPPGKLGVAGPLAGKFPAGTRPVLRVYAGALQMKQILAVPRDAPDRLNLVLQKEGLNEYVIRDEAGKLRAAPPAEPLIRGVKR